MATLRQRHQLGLTPARIAMDTGGVGFSNREPPGAQTITAAESKRASGKVVRAHHATRSNLSPSCSLTEAADQAARACIYLLARSILRRGSNPFENSIVSAGHIAT